MVSREKAVNKMRDWLGYSEKNGMHKKIVDIYNTLDPLPRGHKATYNDEWCAITISACAVDIGATDIIPCECSCNRMIALFKNLNAWVEDDSYCPQIGDIIFYDWEDNGVGDNKNRANHVGMVEMTSATKIVVIEGNKNEKVSRRVIDINGKYIRGYGVPNYDTIVELDYIKTANDVIKGKYGNGKDRKIRLTQAGYDYKVIQSLVNNILKRKKK